MSAAASALTFLYPGELSTPTGGYLYDRALIAALQRAGTSVETRSLGPGYPAPSPEVRAAAARMLAEIPDGRLTVIDGLACGEANVDLDVQQIGPATSVFVPKYCNSGLSGRQHVTTRLQPGGHQW